MIALRSAMAKPLCFVMRKKYVQQRLLHQEILFLMSNLGLIYAYQEQYSEAETMLSRALNGEEFTLALSTRRQLRQCITSTDCYFQNKLDQADSFLQRALNGREKLLGKENSEALGRFRDAENAFKQVLMYIL